MVEGYVGVEGYFDGLRVALAAQLAAVAVVCVVFDTAIDGGVEFYGRHVYLIDIDRLIVDGVGKVSKW